MFDFLSQHKLPDDFSSQEKTLLVLASSTLARVFVIEGHAINELEPLSTEKTDYQYSDKEGFTFTAPQGQGSTATTVGFKETNKMHYDAIFVKYLSKELLAIQQHYGSKDIVVYSPDSLLSHLRDAFPKSHKDIVTINPGNYINVSFPKLFDPIR